MMSGRPAPSGGREPGGTAGLPPMAGGGEELMTRHDVAVLFRVTSQVIAHWARRKQPVLTEVRDVQGRPRYRRAEVEALYHSGFRGGHRHG